MTTILQGDMFNLFQKIEDKSINLFLIDLPYNQTDLKFDKEVIDLKKLWIELTRTGKENACYIFFCTTKFGYKLIQSNEAWFRYDLVWFKPNGSAGFLNAKKQPMRQHEMIYVFYNKQPTYNIEDNHIRINNELTKGIIQGGVYNKKLIRTTGRCYDPKLPVSVLEFPVEKFMKNKRHPTEKPIALYEWLIKYYSKKDDTILDCCFGSGNSLMACKNLNRRYFGFEIDNHYFCEAIKLLI